MTGMAVNINRADRMSKSIPVRAHRGLFDRALIAEGMRRIRTLALIMGILVWTAAALVPVMRGGYGPQTPVLSGPVQINPVLLLCIPVFAPFLTMKAFDFLNSRAGSDLFHSFPVKRQSLAASFLTAVSLWLAVIIGLSILISMASCAIMRSSVTLDTSHLGLWFLQLLAGSLLVFMRVFSDFGTPMLIGEGFKTFPVLIYTQFMGEVSTDDHFAAALCVIVVVITLFLFFLQRMMAKHYSYAMTALKPMQPVYAKGSQKFFAYLFVYGVAFIAMLPQLTVIFTSFLETVGGAVYTGKFSFMNYENTLFSKDNISIFNTYAFGICAIGIVVVLGILISYLTARKPSLLTNILDTLTMFPYIIPGSVLGIALLSGFNSGVLVLSGTALIIIISLTIRRMPYTIRSSTAIISQISPSVEEAAVSLGASEFKSFRKIMVPMMLPGVLAGAIMSWITLISELSSSIILYTSSTSTLTVAIYAEVIRSNFGNAAAYSTILTLTSIVSLLIFFRLTHNEDVSV